MSQTATHKVHAVAPKYMEQILVVPRKQLFANETITWQGMTNDQTVTDHVLEVIKDYQTYIPRYQAEDNSYYKQIIPYLIFKHEDTIFVMQRKKEASESRLANKFSIGIGGHVRKQDVVQATSVFDWAKREFQEEVNFAGKISITPLGMLNDDSDEVGQVHLGLVMLLEADNGNISIKDEHKQGELYTLDECIGMMPSMERWSQLVLQKLQK